MLDLELLWMLSFFLFQGTFINHMCSWLYVPEWVRAWVLFINFALSLLVQLCVQVEEQPYISSYIILLCQQKDQVTIELLFFFPPLFPGFDKKLGEW